MQIILVNDKKIRNAKMERGIRGELSHIRGGEVTETAQTMKP